MKNSFDLKDSTEFIDCINQLTPTSQAKWGKMSVDQMLAHCNVSYEMVYEDKHPKPKGFKKLMLKLFVKSIVVSEKTYKTNGPTAPQFKVTSLKDFEKEKIRLIDHIKKTQELGEVYFHNKESHSFGSLTKDEWNNMFAKNLDHHLKQFGV